MFCADKNVLGRTFPATLFFLTRQSRRSERNRTPSDCFSGAAPWTFPMPALRLAIPFPNLPLSAVCADCCLTFPAWRRRRRRTACLARPPRPQHAPRGQPNHWPLGESRFSVGDFPGSDVWHRQMSVRLEIRAVPGPPPEAGIAGIQADFQAKESSHRLLPPPLDFFRHFSPSLVSKKDTFPLSLLLHRQPWNQPSTFRSGCSSVIHDHGKQGSALGQRAGVGNI